MMKARQEYIEEGSAIFDKLSAEGNSIRALSEATRESGVGSERDADEVSESNSGKEVARLTDREKLSLALRTLEPFATAMKSFGDNPALHDMYSVLHAVRDGDLVITGISMADMRKAAVVYRDLSKIVA